MKKDKVILLLIILLIVIITIISMILFTFNQEEEYINKEEDFVYTEENLQEQQISRVKNNNLFYTIEGCLQKYITYLNLNYEEQLDELNMPSTAAIFGITTKEQKATALINLLDEEFIKDNKINEKNVFEYLSNSFDNVEVKATKINKLIDDNSDVEAYTALAEMNSTTGKEHKFFVIKIDNKNNTFCINPIDNTDYKDLDEIQFINRTKIIEKNANNLYVDMEYSEGQIATRYFQEYKQLILENLSVAYEKLDKDYKEKRFGNIETFKQFIKENEFFIKTMQIYQFQAEKKELYTQYTCMKLNGGYWIIKETAPREYTIMLDTYTIDLPEFIEKYDSATEQVKVGMNIEKIIEALNAKDYQYVYNKLDETFKNNKYNGIDSFKQYIEKNFYSNNDVEYNKFTKQGDTLIYKLRLGDAENSSAKKKTLTIIMKLLEGTDFVFSFNVE